MYRYPLFFWITVQICISIHSEHYRAICDSCNSSTYQQNMTEMSSIKRSAETITELIPSKSLKSNISHSPSSIKFISYNVASLQAAIKKGLLETIRNLNPDILLIQETKLSAEPLVPFFSHLEYPHQYYSHSTIKKGYSGVLVCCKWINYLSFNHPPSCINLT